MEKQLEKAQPRIWHDRSECIVEAFPQYSELFSDVQLKHAWLPKEVQVDKDKQNILVEMSEGDRHGILTNLRLFTNYEVFAGEDWWGGRFKKIVKGPEFSRLGTMNSMAELCIHKPFYQQLNKVLGLDTDEFYSSYVENPVLAGRMKFIDDTINHENDMVALGTFSMVEGGILYSAFGYLKSYQAKGKNDIKTVVSGINYSLADEGLHCTAAATVYRHLTKECKEDGVYEQRYGDEKYVKEMIRQAARNILKHEIEIIRMTFEKGGILHITAEELIDFVKSRLNECLKNLDIEPIFEVVNDTISEWFYGNITSFVMHDFFNSLGSQYTAVWYEEDFYMREGEYLDE